MIGLATSEERSSGNGGGIDLVDRITNAIRDHVDAS